MGEQAFGPRAANPTCVKGQMHACHIGRTETARTRYDRCMNVRVPCTFFDVIRRYHRYDEMGLAGMVTKTKWFEDTVHGGAYVNPSERNCV